MSVIKCERSKSPTEDRKTFFASCRHRIIHYTTNNLAKIVGTSLVIFFPANAFS